MEEEFVISDSKDVLRVDLLNLQTQWVRLVTFYSQEHQCYESILKGESDSIGVQYDDLDEAIEAHIDYLYQEIKYKTLMIPLADGTFQIIM